VELVGIVEEDPSLVEKYAKKHKLAQDLFFSQLGRMIEERHLQVVVVYTSTREHRRVIEEAARHGVSAMVEKPLTISLDDTLAIQKVTRSNTHPGFGEL
jgi:predicted dehydrogenase